MLLLQYKMAPDLASSTLEFYIHDMIRSNELTAAQMAEAAGCNERMITKLRSNIRFLGGMKAPQNKGG